MRSADSDHGKRMVVAPSLPSANAAPARRNLPVFSSWLLLLTVIAKPLSDAFYQVTAVKYGYMLLLGCAALLGKYGQVFQGTTADPRNKALPVYIGLILLYFVFLSVLGLIAGGSLEEIFKIISPFVFFLLVAYAADRWLVPALAIGAALTVLVNAAMLPFDAGWVIWGTVRTFKGYYFFKTDLAYALSYSVLLYALYTQYKITPLLSLLTLFASIEVFLANSRLNYLNFLCVILFIGVKQARSRRALRRFALLVTLLAIAVTLALVHDPAHLLGFNFSNEAAFTQGRSITWTHLIAAQRESSALQWFFGHGPFADLALSARWAGVDATLTGQAYNAHNEFLHMIYTQGAIGCALAIALWVMTFRLSCSRLMPRWARGTGAVALLLYLLQGMTAVTSSFATKTWPLVMVLLALRQISREPGAAQATRIA